jgi:hypothetical protein
MRMSRGQADCHPAGRPALGEKAGLSVHSADGWLGSTVSAN